MRADSFFRIRDIIQKDIEEDFHLNLVSQEEYKEARYVLWKLMTNYPNIHKIPAHYHTWEIFSKNIFISTVIYTIILCFSVKVEIPSIIAIVIFLILIIASWIIINQWIADRAIYSYYYTKENERRQMQFIKTIAKK